MVHLRWYKNAPKGAPIGASHRSLAEWVGGRSEGADNSVDDKVQSNRPAHAPVCADVQTYSAAISACQKGGQWEVSKHCRDP
jgi:hypothetical protein